MPLTCVRLKACQSGNQATTLIMPIIACYYNYLLRMKYFTKQSHLCSIMSYQPIELSLVRIELLSKMLLHGMTLNNNTH